jgi:glutamate synthase domain-containing protein 3
LPPAPSGGIAYVFNAQHEFERRRNREMVDLEPLDLEDLAFVHELISQHAVLTGSSLAARFLSTWSSTGLQFTKVMPRDYKRARATPAVELVPIPQAIEVAHG